VVVTFGLLRSVPLLWFLTNVSGPFIGPIFRVLNPEDGTNIRSRNFGQEPKKRDAG
jgi:hypothetical protein